MSSLSFDVLTGRSEEMILTSSFFGFQLHRQVENDLKKLYEDASLEGFELAVASAFRSFERQLKIFNTKAQRGDELFSILHYSALPGASRHHWGTDFDLFDKSQIEKDYKLQLIPEEFEKAGPFSLFHDWLDKKIEEKDFPFFRPYEKDRGGVACERWHLSHKLSQDFFESYSLEIFEKNIQDSPLELKDRIWENRELIFERYFKNVSLPSL